MSLISVCLKIALKPGERGKTSFQMRNLQLYVPIYDRDRWVT